MRQHGDRQALRGAEFGPGGIAWEIFHMIRQGVELVENGTWIGVIGDQQVQDRGTL